MTLPTFPRRVVRRAMRMLRSLPRLPLSASLALIGGFAVLGVQAQTSLADQPLFSAANVPGNLVLALSVEFPTAVTAADRNAYSNVTKYLGYFDPLKCYTYVSSSSSGNGSFFQPAGLATNYTCSGKWSGNFMNWATMQAVDPFRSALTGGYRNVDTATTTILEKAWAPSNQGSVSSNFPFKSIANATGFSVSQVTPFSENQFNMQVLFCGNTMLFRRTNTSFTSNSGCPSSTPWDGIVLSAVADTVYSVQIRVQVCVSGSSSGDIEANCVKYGSNYKPEGLIQQYSNKIRYSAFGYLNDPDPTSGGLLRDGGVLRARMKFVGPTQPVPGSSAITNQPGATSGQVTSAEWSSTTGVFIANPDLGDASNSNTSDAPITQSGVINYLNQFGRSSQDYKRYDPVSELYYAATRYLRNLPNVPEYSDLNVFNGSTSTSANRVAMKDGFPVITNWTDPILYSCQKNFVLGIGDTNTHADKNLPGNTSYRGSEPAMPSSVSSDPIDVIAATNKVGVLEGIGTSIGTTSQYNSDNNSAYMAGMAYLFNTTDIRSDLPGTQTIQTYWLDVLEGGDYKGGNSGRNQFYLAAKYGGFAVPSNYSYATNTTPLPTAWWATTGDTVSIPNSGGPRPDNFFLANQASVMVKSLTSAFSSISAAAGSFGSSFSGVLPQVASSGNGSYSTQYDPANWTGEVTASELTFDSAGVPTVVTPSKWTFSAKLAAQAAGTGWNTQRRVVTWNGTSGVAFRASGSSAVASSDLSALDTSYTNSNDASDYLNYLRGDTSNEAGCSSNCASSPRGYRTRAKLLGDIVGSKAVPVGTPSWPYADTTNPGYSAFKTLWANRRTAVYVGANDGMMHAINGALVATATTGSALEADANFGTELFAYVPQALFQGPSATPTTNGLASLGNPSFVHHYMVNASPAVIDVDFARTPNAITGLAPTGNPTPDWRSLLIGGLGKGGKAYYAIDVTDPVGMSANESAAAGKVLWEFSNSTTGVMTGTTKTLGYTFGEPMVLKTPKYGWVVVFTSGYSNDDGKGYFFFVNPKTGALLEKVATGIGSTSTDAGLAHANAFVVDSTDGTADAIYAGDLLGNLWRLDVRATSGAYAAPVKLATFTDAGSPAKAQPITTRPSVEVHPVTNKRVVMVGTGRLLDTSDIASTQVQSFYFIADGTNAVFNVTGSPLSLPYTRSVLANDSNTLTGTTFDPTTQAGYYYDLAGGYRVLSDSTTVSGTVAFAGVLPNGDVCSPGGNSRIYGNDFATGVTILQALNNSGVLTSQVYVPQTGVVSDLRFLSVSGKAVLLSGSSDTGTVSKVATTPLGNLKLRRMNWRELPVAQ